MATVQEILNYAYAKSFKNQPGKIANEAVELLAQYNRAIGALYTIAATVNPTYFAKKTSMAESGGTWTEPTDSEAIFYLTQDSDGAEVVVVLVDEQDAEPGLKAVYSLGRIFQASGTNPPTGAVTAYYSKSADVETALGDTIDTTWNESYNELLVLEIAIFLALKDGRADEVPGLIAQRNAELKRFVQGLSSHLANIRSQYGPYRAITTHQVFTPSELLLGEGP